ncbi:hypothetical protein BOFL111202_13755 [Bordetella flabilis]
MRTVPESPPNRGELREESETTCGRKETRRKVEEAADVKVVDPPMCDRSSAELAACRRIKRESPGVAALSSDAEVALRFPLGNRVARRPRKG